MSKKQLENESKNQSLGVALVLIATIGLSAEAIAAKVAYANGVSILSALSLRYMVAALLFWIGVITFKYSFKLPRKQLLQIMALAIGGQSVTVLFLFLAFQYIPSAMAILFLYLYPTFVTFLAYFLLKEAITWQKLAALVLSLGGCAVILGQPLHGLDMRGVWFSVGAAVFNSFMLVGTARLLKVVRVPVYNAYMTLTVAILFTVAALVSGELHFNHTLEGWAAILVLGVICTALALATLFKGVSYIGASRAAIISTLEPAATAVLAFWILNETLTGTQALGGALIMVGVLLQKRG